MEKPQVEKLIKTSIEKQPKKFIPFKQLEQRGFSRRKCNVCGKNFWSTSERDVCGDVSCVGHYSFLDSRITNIKLSQENIWKRFSKMFRGTGHKEIERYPVVARWRDDIFFVEAAIDDFAPYVINGVAEPPANPLIVPQICLRFNDINNVGLTGRHLTSFIMAEQAAFNTKTKRTYFDSEAIVYIYDWLTRGLGIDKNELVFNEDAWVGAGYAGNSLEFFAGGLELGNQVYMRYSVDYNGLKDLKTKTIDMGAGLNRWAWISQGTPTVYEAVFPKVIDFIKNKVSIDYPEARLKKVYKVLGQSDFEVTDLKSVIKGISKEIGDMAGIIKMIKDMRAVYAIADHTRTLLVAMHDGALPSNVGGGYNLRNIFRRSLDLINESGWKLDLNDVIEEHKKEFGSWFKELKEYDASDIIKKEIERYKDFKVRTNKTVSSIIKGGSVSEEEMLKLYSSNGITIDDIRHEAELSGIDIALPNAFYTKINKHEFDGPKKLKLDTSKLAATKKLFYDENLHSTEAKIIKKFGDDAVVLDRTIFYPEMGGQKPDHGYIDDAKVVDVQKQEDVIIHSLETAIKKGEGKLVKLRLDVDRRELLRRHHTATHIINQACRRVLGDFVYQNGAEKDVDKAHLDITYYDNLTDAQIKAIEHMANDIVAKNLEMTVSMVDRTEAEKRYGMSIYQGGAVPSAKLRIVQIKDYDVEACGGLHCHRTGDVGVIKIVKTERIQDGVVRLVFMAYKPAINFIEDQEKIIRELSNVWGVGQNDVVETAQRFFSGWKRYKDLYEKSEEERLYLSIESKLNEQNIEVTTTFEKSNDLIRILSKVKPKLQNRSLAILSANVAIGYPNSEYVKSRLAKKYKNIIEKPDFIIASI